MAAEVRPARPQVEGTFVFLAIGPFIGEPVEHNI